MAWLDLTDLSRHVDFTNAHCAFVKACIKHSFYYNLAKVIGENIMFLFKLSFRDVVCILSTTFLLTGVG